MPDDRDPRPGILAVIPARGGSKGIPRKNLRPLAGRPLVAHTISQARATQEIGRVVVSTDDDEIARVSTEWGAEVVRRPEELAGDEASSESALLHALDRLRASEGYEPELLVFLQATSPLRRPHDIADAIATLRREGADSLFSACPVHGFVWRLAGGALRSLTYDCRKRPRRQEIGEDLLENGSIYVLKPEVLRETNNRLGGRIAVYRMDPLDSFQVDEPEDLELMERLLAGRTVSPPPSRAELSHLRLLVLDFDGVMTDDRVLVDQDGREAVLCHRGDGLGLELLRSTGVEVLVLSREENPVVAARCRKLELTCIQSCKDKLARLQDLARERRLESSRIAYVGNDVNDLACLKWVGWPIAVADATPEVRAVARFVTERPGGGGAVREICDLIRAASGNHLEE